MNFNTNIHSIIISFLTIKELKEISTINKIFYNDIILNKKTIQEMIINELNIEKRDFLFLNMNKFIVDILLIKYKNISTIYDKYKNIDNDFSKNLSISILDDIFELIGSHLYDPYSQYIMTFVYIDTIFINILNRNFGNGINRRLLDILNKHLNICKDDPKMLRFIYLTSKRISYSSEPIFTFDENQNSYFLSLL